MPGGVRPLLRTLVPGVGGGPPDPIHLHSREGPYTPVATHGLCVQQPVGHVAAAQQESRLNANKDAHRLFFLKFMSSFQILLLENMTLSGQVNVLFKCLVVSPHTYLHAQNINTYMQHFKGSS